MEASKESAGMKRPASTNQIQAGQKGRISNAVVLAAGMGQRLRPITDQLPKPLLPVNGIPILENTLKQLERLGISNTTIVVGHLATQIESRFGTSLNDMRIRYIFAGDYQRTNNIVSLWHARDAFTSDTLLIEGDVFFEPDVIRRVLEPGRKNVLAVDRFRHDMKGAAVTIAKGGRITSLSILPSCENQGDFFGSDLWKTLSIHSFTYEFCQNHLLPEIAGMVGGDQTGTFYEIALSKLIERKVAPIFAAICEDLRWVEVDDFVDFGQAQFIFFEK